MGKYRPTIKVKRFYSEFTKNEFVIIPTVVIAKEYYHFYVMFVFLWFRFSMILKIRDWNTRTERSSAE